MIDKNIRDGLIIESILDWVWEINIETGEAKTSDNFKKSLGYSASEITDNINYWHAIIHPEDVLRYKTIIEDILNNNLDVFENEFRINTKSGEYKWVLGKGKVFRDAFKKPLYLSGIFVDITARRRAEENERKFKNLVDLSPHTVVIHKDGIVTYANERALDLIRVDSMDSIIGEPIEKYILPFYKDISSKRLSLLADGHGILPMEMELLRPDGSKIFAEISTTIIPDETGYSFISYVRDTTEHKLILEQNKKLLDQALEYDRLKTEFFSNISHELRTPLNIMMSSIQLLNIFYENKATNLNKFFYAYEKYIPGLQQNSYRLLKLINNLIDITKFDSGFFKMEYTNLNIVEMVEDIAQSVAPYIENKGISLIFDTDVEEKIQAVDVLKLERILLNLLSNAIKFTSPGGTIEVTVKAKESSVLISIKDTGCGIPSDMLQVIFERFRQVDSLLTRRAEGSGIGLSLVKALIEAHEGTITVNSTVGVGSEFIIELPMKVIPACRIDSEQITSDSQMKVDRINIELSDIYT